MKSRNILFANLVQNTKESRLNIPWKKITTQKDPLLYAKAELEFFHLFADYSEDKNTSKIYFGFMCITKPSRLQVLPGVWDTSENIIECGFFDTQQKGLQYFQKLQKMFSSFNVLS